MICMIFCDFLDSRMRGNDEVDVGMTRSIVKVSGFPHARE